MGRRKIKQSFSFRSERIWDSKDALRVTYQERFDVLECTDERKCRDELLREAESAEEIRRPDDATVVDK